jgi:hypothetical protein
MLRTSEARCGFSAMVCAHNILGRTSTAYSCSSFGVEAVREGVAPGFLFGSVELGEGVGETEAYHALGCADCDFKGDLATHREADDDELFECERIGEVKDVLGVGGKVLD